ncbi:MAG: hypothetical protein AAGC92_00850 [Pseudomonadota bacterium]
MSIIPTSYDDWKHCITVSCGIPLTPSFVQARIAALSDASDFHTKKFIESWGQVHHAQTLAWFEQAARELSA